MTICWNNKFRIWQTDYRHTARKVFLHVFFAGDIRIFIFCERLPSQFLSVLIKAKKKILPKKHAYFAHGNRLKCEPPYVSESYWCLQLSTKLCQIVQACGIWLKKRSARNHFVPWIHLHIPFLISMHALYKKIDDTCPISRLRYSARTHTHATIVFSKWFMFVHVLLLSCVTSNIIQVALSFQPYNDLSPAISRF